MGCGREGGADSAPTVVERGRGVYDRHHKARMQEQGGIIGGAESAQHTLHPSSQGVPFQSSKDEERTLQDCATAPYWNGVDTK